jgi:hypothetical protein
VICFHLVLLKRKRKIFSHGKYETQFTDRCGFLSSFFFYIYHVFEGDDDK